MNRYQRIVRINIVCICSIKNGEAILSLSTSSKDLALTPILLYIAFTTSWAGSAVHIVSTSPPQLSNHKHPP